MRTTSVRRCCYVLALLLAAPVSDAGPHLGMKSACKQYGDAWRSGARHHLMAVSGAGLRSRFSRLNQQEFRAMLAASNRQVVGVAGSHKSGGNGWVTVQTDRGPVRFHLIGGGFQWQIVDVFSLEQGQWVSLTDRLDVTFATREFHRQLTDVGTPFEPHGASVRFQKAMTSVPLEQIALIRRSLGHAKGWDGLDSTVQARSAEVRVRRQHDTITFYLTRDGRGWLVDDVRFECAALRVVSLRASFDTYGAALALGASVKRPGTIRDFSFVGEGDLRRELSMLGKQATGATPRSQTKSCALAISDDGKDVSYTDGNRVVRLRLEFDESIGRRHISQATVQDPAGTQSLAARLTWRRQWVDGISVFNPLRQSDDRSIADIFSFGQ